MEKHFEAAAILLETIWFAAEHIDNVAETVDWDSIHGTMDRIMPSTTEQLRFDLAMNCYYETGIFGKFGLLDQDNKA